MRPGLTAVLFPDPRPLPVSSATATACTRNALHQRGGGGSHQAKHDGLRMQGHRALKRAQRLQHPDELSAGDAASAKRRNGAALGSGNEKENTMQILIKPANYAQMLLNCTGLEPDADAAVRMLLDAIKEGNALVKNAPTEWLADVIHALHKV